MPDGQLTVALEFAPKAGFAIDTNDAVIGQDLPMLQLGLLVVIAVALVSGLLAELLALG